MMFARGQKPFIIAEVAQTHDGNINIAHAFIDAVAKTGADAVKFQTHIAAEESTPREQWRIKFSHQDVTRYDYWKRMEFTPEQWQSLKTHADEKGLMFLSSPFSIAAIELLEQIGVPAWKVGSGEVLSARMIERMAQTGKPIIMSSGMSDLAEIDGIVSGLKKRGVNYAIMQCTTAYPSSFAQVGLNVIQEYQSRYACAVGLSDHSGTIWPSVAALALGADLIEVHVTMSRDMFGPDVSSSVTMEEMAQLTEGAKAIYTMRQNPVNKSVLTEDLVRMRGLFMKSIVARHDLAAGTILNLENLTEKKPAGGIAGHLIARFEGIKLLKPLAVDEALGWSHISADDRKRIDV